MIDVSHRYSVCTMIIAVTSGIKNIVHSTNSSKVVTTVFKTILIIFAIRRSSFRCSSPIAVTAALTTTVPFLQQQQKPVFRSSFGIQSNQGTIRSGYVPRLPVLSAILSKSAASVTSTRSSRSSSCTAFVSRKDKYNRQTRVSATILSNMVSTTTTTGSLDTAATTGTVATANVTEQQQHCKTPPIADRDMTGVIYAGIAPPDWNIDVPRQDESSTEMMMDPPIPIIDPYSWMRDDTRTNPKVVQHLQNENEYTNSMTQHLTTAAITAFTEQVPSDTTTPNTTSNTTTTSSNSNSIVTTLYNEMISKIQESDYSTPRPNQSYMYYSRTIEGMAYKIYCRSSMNANDNEMNRPKLLWHNEMTNAERMVTSVYNNEQILLNVNDLAKNQSYCAIGTTEISPSQNYYAYTIDYTGDEICTLCILDVSSSRSGAISDTDDADTTSTATTTAPTVVVHENTVQDFPISGMIEWGNTDATIYYTTLDSAQRPYQVYCRVFDTTTTAVDGNNEINFQKYTDTLIYEDLNDSHYVSIYKSQDTQYLFIESSSKETTEIHYISLLSSTTNNESEQSSSLLHCIAARRSKVLYEIDHYNGYWWITSNVNSSNPNMALYTAPAIPDCEHVWSMVVQKKNDDSTTTGSNNPLFDGGIQSSLEGITCFQNHIVAYGRQDGLPQIWIIGEVIQPSITSVSTNSPTTTMVTVVANQFEKLIFDEDAYDVILGTNYEYNTSKIVIMYDSMITPTQSIEIDMYNTTQLSRTVIKQTTVPGYDKTQYQCERKMVLSRDGTTQIPISIVYRKDVMELHTSSKQPVPVHLYGYGSYGASMECDFVATRLPLLQRNMIYIVAHVRGGSEMGRHWYEEPNGAKYLCKMNTFYDFVDVAQYLINDIQLTTSELLSCEGRSAGGLLIGASINLAPELFRVAILGVPFVDVVPTMIDASIPLTAGEWEEWGNPNEMKYFEYMMTYTPTFNVKMGVKYPACLLTGGLHDPRVQYWEPAKFAAALRYGQQSPQNVTDGVTGDTTLDEEHHRPVCLKIDMSAGHFSASDRYKYYKEKAFDYAFLLDQLGLVGSSNNKNQK